MIHQILFDANRVREQIGHKQFCERWLLVQHRNIAFLSMRTSLQMGHAKATTTLDHYAKWLPNGERRFVNVLDTQLEKLAPELGTKLT